MTMPGHVTRSAHRPPSRWLVSWLALSVLLGPAFALLGRHEALAWPLSGHSCLPGASLAACTFPRPEWRTPFVWSIGGAVIGLVLGSTLMAIIRWRRPWVWAGACVLVGSVVGLFEGAAAQNQPLREWAMVGAAVGLLGGLVLAALWLGERWVRAEPRRKPNVEHPA